MKNKGFTLIEMMVAVAVFALLVGTGSSIFLSSIRSQRQSLATQEVLDQTSYLMEYMSKALRMAQKDMSGACTGTAKSNYSFESQCIKFVSYQDECQQFCLENARLKNQDGYYLTSESLTVSVFNVVLAGEEQAPVDNQQPRITVFLEVQGKEGSNIKMQTTISQRNPDVQK